MRINRHNSRKILDLELPDRLRASKLLQADAQNTLHALGINLGSTSNAMQVNASMLLACLLCFGPHTAFPNNCLDTESLDNVGLVGFLANRCRWTGCDNFIAIAFL